MRRTLIPLAATASSLSGNAQAHRYGLFVGPPALGVGDPNPVTFVSPLEYEAQFVSEDGWEVRAAVIGIAGGPRLTSKWGGYVSIGGGLMLNANGWGAGPSASVGYDFFCVTICGSIEYFQAVGFGTGGLMSPYALRLGVSLWL